ncbi:MAG: GIY-YIG nuclease family protein [Sedimentisphaerales bacterium]|nr:GIY-YIG nuclease family protein [Sedimentisphaerales bacterium]
MIVLLVRLAVRRSAYLIMVTVYVLQGANKRYVGITNKVARRLAEHRSGRTKGAQVIGQFRLLHREEYPDYASAREREKFLKSGRGREFLTRLYSGTGSAAGG